MRIPQPGTDEMPPAALSAIGEHAASSAIIYYEGRVVAEGAIASVDAVEARLAGGHEGLLAGMFVELELTGALPAGDRRRAVVLESSADAVRFRLEDADPEGPHAAAGGAHRADPTDR